MLEEAIRILKEKNESPHRRMDAIFIIGEKFRPEYFTLFKEILEDPGEHPEVRSALALMLGKLGRTLRNNDEVLRLLSRHAHDENITVKNYSIQALGLLGREEAAETLIEALEDEDNIVFSSAAEALGELGHPAAPPLVRLLDEGADDAKCVAAWKLGEMRYVDAIPKLVEVIQQDSNTEVMALSIWALGEIGMGPNEVLDILNWAREHQAPEVHQRASMAIKKIARHSN